MAHQRALVRACRPGFRAGLPTCVGRKAGDGFGVDILAAPAMVRPGLLDQGGIATWTAPTFGLVRARVLLPFLHLVRVPFLHTVEVRYGPADGAGPHLGVPQDFVCADDALVLAVVDILMDTRGKICCCRFWHILRNRLPPLLRNRCKAIKAKGCLDQ